MYCYYITVTCVVILIKNVYTLCTLHTCIRVFIVCPKVHVFMQHIGTIFNKKKNIQTFGRSGIEIDER